MGRDSRKTGGRGATWEFRERAMGAELGFRKGARRGWEIWNLGVEGVVECEREREREVRVSEVSEGEKETDTEW
jgi:hypothetical protein